MAPNSIICIIFIFASLECHYNFQFLNSFNSLVTIFYSVPSGCLSVRNMYLPSNWGLVHALPMIWKAYIFHAYHFVFIIIHFIFCHTFSSYIHNFGSLTFQSLFSIQDHFLLASVILNVPTCEYVPYDPFWVRLNKCSSISHCLCILCIP